MLFAVSPVLALRARETNKRAEINLILWFRYALRFALSYSTIFKNKNVISLIMIRMQKQLYGKA
ncbi:MAG: hypothetical protein HOE30_05045 [Deltaproteobacteria bacterium]|nr:hypothetical protein [Deltaproteobacteria bacterium]